jgi:hypothetical protein
MKTITQHYIDGAFVESYGRRVPVAAQEMGRPAWSLKDCRIGQPFT